MFRSHLLSMVLFALIVSVLLSLIKTEGKKAFFRYMLKLFLYMVFGVILFSWVMRFF